MPGTVRTLILICTIAFLEWTHARCSWAATRFLEILKRPAARVFLEETPEGAEFSRRFFGKPLKVREIKKILTKPRGKAEPARFQAELEARLADRETFFLKPQPTPNPLKKIGNFFRKMKECLKNAPPEAAQSHRLRYFFTQLGLSEAMTTGGYIAASGTEPVDWKNLPTDLMVEGVESILRSTMITSGGTFLLRWLRVSGVGAATSVADATIYFLSPLKDTHNVPAEVVSLQRMKYHLAYDIAAAPVEMTFFDLLAGMECMNPGVQWKLASTGLQFAFSAGSNVLFFSLRKNFVSQGDRAEPAALQ